MDNTRANSHPKGRRSAIKTTMDHHGEDLRNLQTPVTKNLDEMSQQTLDALKLVHSFESKPARSERIRLLLERKMSNQPEAPLKSHKRPTSSPVRSHTAQRVMPGACGQPTPQHTQCLSYFSSNTANVTSKSSTHSDKVTSTPIKEIEVTKIESLQRPAVTKPVHPRLPKPSATKLSEIGNKSSVGRNLGSLKSVGGDAATTTVIPTTRTKGSSTTYSSLSRLMQPTAASVAKANTRVLPKLNSRGLMHHIEQAKTGVFDTSCSSIGYNFRPGALPRAQKPLSASKGAAQKRTTTNNKKPPMHAEPLSIVSVPSQPASEVSTLAAKPCSNPYLDSPSKGSQVATINPSMLILEHPHNSPATNSPATNSPATNSPAKTSTPVRPLIPLIEQDHSSMQSIDYSHFTNFSYVADWAQTPELVTKALEQRNVDTLRLFGSIPPVDLEAIFGSEIKKQQRG